MKPNTLQHVTSIQSEREREREREVERKREISEHTLRQLKGVLLSYKKNLKCRKMNQKGLCALIFCAHILVMSIFSKTMGWGDALALNPPLRCRYLHVCIQSTYGIGVDCFV